MRPLGAPFEDIVAGRPATIAQGGQWLLGGRMLTKETAFTDEERDAFDLRGLLPDRVLTIEQQIELELGHIRVQPDPLAKYISLTALQDRNATLFYRLLADHLDEFLPVVYTPTVGRACQEYSHIIRRTRGTWITPRDVGRVSRVLGQGPFPDVRLIVVTDAERILGLGDQGAGGMAIPIGKLALYTAASGIHPSLTLPVTLDVGTDNHDLLGDPLYLGVRERRMRGEGYEALVEAFVAGVQEVWPGCVIQFEDFKQQNALRLLHRYRDRAPVFNDDIQGTAAVVVAGVLASQRITHRSWSDERVVIVGAGAAGIGIARLLRAAIEEAGGTGDIALVDSKGLVHAGRTDLDEWKREVAVEAEVGGAQDLEAVTRARRPTILVGVTGIAGTFPESVVRAMCAGLADGERPVVMPLSNPDTSMEARAADVIAWSGGRALVATGSPSLPVSHGGMRIEVGQANNAFVFPGVGLGAVVAEARTISDRMFLIAARTLADAVADDRLASGALYPAMPSIREVSRAIAIAVATQAVAEGSSAAAERDGGFDPGAEVDAATWWPAYVPYVRG
ncbi:MAG: oxaloacetate-decarboxylating malate dehydrogenase [Candidatus Limnocylindrales bacterium]